MFERPRAGPRAVLVHILLAGREYARAQQEFEELVHSAGAEAARAIGGSRYKPDPKYFVGSGKAQEIAAAVEEEAAGLVVVNHDLTPSQERNLESLVNCRVLDRTGLILDIFARRARSHEGKLQVELAQLEYLSTRLVRGWSHLERQKGGIGLRGPGETQLETDRRLLGARIRKVRSRLEKVRQTRWQGRQARQYARVPLISLVGYTNAGKSTLFNRLTGASTYSNDQLFATLDPTLRKLRLPVGDPVVLADTVGFIRDLPHRLIAAFQATLEETREARVLLHVIDAADPERAEQTRQVNAVLEEIGAADVGQIQVYNKIDLEDDEPPRIERDRQGRPVKVYLSAVTGAGAALVRRALAERLFPDRQERTLHIPPQAGRLRSRLFDAGVVKAEDHGPGGYLRLQVAASDRQLERICRQEGVAPAQLETIPG